MDDRRERSCNAGEQLFEEARALALALVAIRRAQGKANPADFPVGTPEWIAVIQDFAEDVLRAPVGNLARFAPLAQGKSPFSKRA
jgi:hypothetical protein